jgi:hypothetical protein
MIASLSLGSQRNDGNRVPRPAWRKHAGIYDVELPEGGLFVPKPYSPEQIVGTLNDLTGAPALPARPQRSDIVAAQSNGHARIG